MPRIPLPMIAALALLLLALGACAAAPDDTWLRITSIQEGGGEGEAGAALSVFDVDLRDETTDTVDVTVENVSMIVGTSGGVGVSITVYQARVEYDHRTFDLPSFEYGITLLLPAPGSGEAGIAGETGTITGLPVAPAALKSWILSPVNVPAEISATGLQSVVTITLRARTEEGRELEVTARLTLNLN